MSWLGDVAGNVLKGGLGWPGWVLGNLGNLGNISEFFTGSKRRGEAERQVRGLTGAEAYQPFGETPEGRRLREALMSQVMQSYAGGRRGALTTAATQTAGRGMLSSTVLPYAQGQLMAPVEEAKGMGIARVGQTMGGIEAQLREQWMRGELEKKLAAAGYWAKAGEAPSAGMEWGSIIAGMFPESISIGG